MRTPTILAIALLAMCACGGSGKESASAADKSEAMCPATDAALRSKCGCRPTEEYYVSQAAQVGGKEAALACATGSNPGSKMVECMKAKGETGATIAMMGSPTVKDDAFDACAAK